MGRIHYNSDNRSIREPEYRGSCMKNTKRFPGILISLLICAAAARVVIAREVSSTPATPDAWSVHGGAASCYSGGYVAGCEIAVDQTGNLVPTVTAVQTLGTPSLSFSNVYATTLTITGAWNFGAQNVFGTLPNVSTITSAGIIQAPSIVDAGALSVAGTSTLAAANVSGNIASTAALLSVSSSATSAFSLTIDGAYTSAQIAAKTPSKAGQLIFNTTLPNLCVSTGATIQGYKLAGTASTACQ